VVHEVRPAGDGGRLERQRLDQARLRLRRRRDRRPFVLLVEVVEQADVDAAVVRADERVPHDVGRVVVQAQVVERELERLLRGRNEVRDSVRDVERGLPAVGQRVDGDRWLLALGNPLILSSADIWQRDND
jgi:hypothetical protein